MSIAPLNEETSLSGKPLETDMVSYKENLVKMEVKSPLPEYNFNKTKEGSPKKNKGEPEELNQMKELLLSHLDYIQQQTDYLSSKDKTINDLKIENEMLKQRIHRMGRRVSLTKTRSTAENGSQPPRPSTSSQRPHRKPSANTMLSPRKRQRQDSFDNQEGRLRKKRPKEEKKKDKDKEGKKTKKNLEEEKGSLREGLSSPNMLKVKSESSLGPLLARFEKLTLTTNSYYTAVGEENDLNPSPYRLIPPAPKATLEVPKWTIKTYTSSYTLEGTENLSDDVFDRRHFRLAIDEKRRKRWDVQRIREQRQIEKLREREKKRNAKLEAINNPTPITSFWPDPDEITDRLSLVVTDKIPVAIFGISLPHCVESEPTLWWQNGKIQISTKTKRKGKR